MFSGALSPQIIILLALRATTQMSIPGCRLLIQKPKLLSHSLRFSLGKPRFASQGPVYEPPSGLLFNEVKTAGKRIKEPWENIWMYGFGGCMLFGIFVGYARPDTGIQTWALEEAQKRLKEEGVDLLPKRD